MKSAADKTWMDNMDLDFSEEDLGTRIQIDHKGILKNLQCPICWEILVPPIRQCVNGHCVCGNCFASIKNCGLCRQKLVNRRCLAVEAVLDNLSFKCANMADGCSAILKVGDLAMHEKSCPFRPVECYVEGGSHNCRGKLIALRHYKWHLIHVHQLSTMSDGDDDTDVNNFRIKFYDNDIMNDSGFWPLVYFYYDNQMFVVQNALKGETFTSWVTCVGSEVDAQKYTVSITLEPSQSSTKVQSVWSDLPVMTPHCQCLEDLGNSTGYASKSISELQSYFIGTSVHPTNEIEYSFSWSAVYKCAKLDEKK